MARHVAIRPESACARRVRCPRPFRGSLRPCRGPASGGGGAGLPRACVGRAGAWAEVAGGGGGLSGPSDPGGCSVGAGGCGILAPPGGGSFPAERTPGGPLPLCRWPRATPPGPGAPAASPGLESHAAARSPGSGGSRVGAAARAVPSQGRGRPRGRGPPRRGCVPPEPASVRGSGPRAAGGVALRGGGGVQERNAAAVHATEITHLVREGDVTVSATL